MYLLVLSISNSACQLLATFVDVNLQWEDKDSGSDRLIEYAEVCFYILTGDSRIAIMGISEQRPASMLFYVHC